jgi:hypothetical protein
LARKRKKSRAKKKGRSKSKPSTDAVEVAAPDVEAVEVDVEAADDEIVVDLDADLGNESVEDLLAAAAGLTSATSNDVGDAPGPADNVDDVHDLDAEVGEALGGNFGLSDELDLVGLSSEPKWLDVPEDPAPTAAYEDDDDDLVEISLDDDTDDADRDRLIAEALAFVAAEPGESEGVDDDAQDDLPSPQTQYGEELGNGPTDAATEGDSDPLISGGYSLPPVRDNQPPPRITADALQALSEIHTEGLARVDDDILLDLGDPDSSEDRDRLLQSALAHAAMQEAIYRVPGTEGQPRSAKPFLVGAIVAVALFVAAAPPSFLAPSPPAEITAADRLTGYRVTLLLQAQQIDAFRAVNGRLPRSLAELQSPFPGIQFVASNNRLYQLVVRTDDRTLIYDSATPDPAFAALTDRWTTTRGGL